MNIDSINILLNLISSHFFSQLNGNVHVSAQCKAIIPLLSNQCYFCLAQFLKSPAFSYLLIALLLILFIWFILRLNSRRLLIEKRKLEKIVDERTSEINLQKNEIEKQRDDIVEKNQILEQQKEEILAQSEDILEKNQILEQQKLEIEAQKYEIEKQRDLLEEQNTNMKNSINYASKIQIALLPPEEVLNEIIPNNFVFYKPKDIVSGDFYWIRKIKNIIVVATADCTGHGIPGALMSMLGMSQLNEIYNRSWLYNPGAALDILRRKIKQSLRQNDGHGKQRDGIDISLYAIDTETLELQFAGAYNSICIIRKKEVFEHAGNFNILEDGSNMLIEIKADKQPIGIHPKESEFTTKRFQLKLGDSIYSFTDGYYDQLGGVEYKKFKSDNFKKLLLELYPNPPQIQKEILNSTIESWKDKSEQTDDILVIGIQINKENFS